MKIFIYIHLPFTILYSSESVTRYLVLFLSYAIELYCKSNNKTKKINDFRVLNSAINSTPWTMQIFIIRSAVSQKLLNCFGFLFRFLILEQPNVI